ncbi:MAG: helix-turn-helix transcriptional regulator [Ktedonobacteraceae bacterium]|nr:helix-turn-helix transcriptional regulator [Ktedonobacteraceae bacterium]
MYLTELTAAYKEVMLLGLLMERPMYGQQIREVIEKHHRSLAGYIKKPSIYYQLDRLVNRGDLEVRREAVEAPGPGAAHEDLAPRERDVYYITASGRQHFYQHLRKMLSQYTPGLNEAEACLFFLHYLSTQEAVTLLAERLQQVRAYRAGIVAQMAERATSDEAHELIYDYKLTLLDAEIHWLERTLERLRGSQDATAFSSRPYRS